MTAGIDLTTGLVTWTFQSIDPTTGVAPTGLLSGFLPPDDSAGDGEGFVTYSAQPMAGATTGTTISAQASVVFDTNAPLKTPTFVNTIDAGAPTSTVTAALPADRPSSFTVELSPATTSSGGSGIGSFTIYSSDNNGPFIWLTTTSDTSTTFTGQPGHTYGFYSVATDNVGNVQPTPSAAQATTFVPFPSSITLASDQTQGATYGQTVDVTATVSRYVRHAGRLGAVHRRRQRRRRADGAAGQAAAASMRLAGDLAAGSHNISASVHQLRVDHRRRGSLTRPAPPGRRAARLTIVALDEVEAAGGPLPSLAARLKRLRLQRHRPRSHLYRAELDDDRDGGQRRQHVPRSGQRRRRSELRDHLRQRHPHRETITDAIPHAVTDSDPSTSR